VIFINEIEDEKNKINNQVHKQINSMNTVRPIVTALLSYGMSGEVFHAPLLAGHTGFELRKVLQRSSDKAKQRYPNLQVVRTLDDILSDKEIELVVVNTTNDTHYDFTRQALEAGKHVIVEKPFTNTSNEGQMLIDLANKQGKMLSVFQNRRWDGGFLTVKSVMEWGLLGKVVTYEAHYDRFRNYIPANTWKENAGPGSGILYNLGSHMLDQVLVLFGMPQAIDARMGAHRPGGQVDDYYDIRLTYNDLNVIVKSSYLVREAGPQYVVHGLKGSFIKYGYDPQEEALKRAEVPGKSGWGMEPETYWGKLNTEINGLHFEGKIETLPGNYMHYYQNIFEHLREEKALIVKPEQSLQIIQLIEAATKSNKEKRAIEF
jgi:scyllo-inositol 2-dehydrogenase (NADP+)